MSYKILFGNKYFGKDVSECPSGFLIWCIEEYPACDFLLSQACKTELSERLKIEWLPAPNPTREEIINGFKMHVADEWYKSGAPEEILTQAVKGWLPKNDYTKEVALQMFNAIGEIVKLKSDIEHLRDIVGMSCTKKNWNYYDVDRYLSSRELLASDLELIKEIQSTN